MNNRKLQVWIPLLLAIVMIFGMYIGFKLRENTTISGNFFKTEKKSSLQEVLDLIRMKYVDPVNLDSLDNDAIQGMLQYLDPHSIYIQAEELNVVNADLRGNFDGIGVEFQIFSDTVHVTNVIKDGPSEKAGVMIGDKILKAGDSTISGVKRRTEDIRRLLKGPRNSQVTVQLLRNGEPVTLTITRGRIPLPSVDAAYMIDPTVGFIRINKFSETTYEEFMQSLEALQAKGMKKLILDLRDNGGGLLNEAVDIADEFLDGDKLIVYTEGAKVPRQEYRARREGLFEKGELVLLINESSASASEVLAGALQDWDRATIIGRRSFAKGLVQEQYTLSDGSALRLTVARYYTPLGRSIQKPYDKGKESYQHEVSERFNNGELLRTDTSYAHNGKVYTTRKGKKLYGGGGITPDIFVAIDTNTLRSVPARLYTSGTIYNYVYNYFVANRQSLTQYKDAMDFASGFKEEQQLFEGLKDFAKKDSIIIPPLAPEREKEVKRWLMSLLARQIWRSEGYFELTNKDDRAVQKALEILK